MTNWDSLSLVLRREIVERGRSKAYIASLVFTLLLVSAAFLIPQFTGGRDIVHEVGAIGEGNEAILEVAESLALTAATDDREVFFNVTRYFSMDEAEAALEEGSVEVVLADGARLLRQESGGFDGADLDRYLQRAAASLELGGLLEGAGRTADDVAGILTSELLEVEVLAGPDAGERQARSLIAYGGMMLLYFATLSFGAWTLSGITEEKGGRVVEVLLATLKPWQLFAGKVIGIGILGLGQFLLTIGTALVLIRVTDTFELPALPIDSAVTLVLWFILGYFVFSIAFGMAGAVVSRSEDAQTAASPLTILFVFGFFISTMALEDPSSTVAVVTSFIPITAPFVVPIRVAFEAIPAWQHALAVVAALASIVVLVRVAGRIYAGGVLHYGGRLKFREAFRNAEL